MTKHAFYLYVERTQPAINMARFYALSIEPSLFGTISLVRRWGRIGTTGQEKIHLFEDETEAVTLFLHVARQKRQRGYIPRQAASGRLLPAYCPHDAEASVRDSEDSHMTGTKGGMPTL